jgi:asparagine synthase (glutamine-hydrolysing)
MCGIAGFTGKSDKVELDRMLNSILYRGPDENGQLVENNQINFCHARLSIIDLVSGKQPLEISDCIIVFNGEIYNYLEINEELKSLGYNLKTKSDTETILLTYLHFGERFLQKLNGMFSFAIYDKKKKKLLIACDPFGIKPLYYTIINNELFFSSSQKTLIENKNFHKRLNSKTLSEIIQFRYSINGNALLKDVTKLKAGELLIWCNTKKSKKTIKYDNGFSKFDNLKLSSNEWINECYQIFDDSIKINLRSDVPVGIFLSSGIDSAGILHFAKKNEYQNLHGYSFSTNQSNDETKNISDLSESYNLKTTYVSLDENNFFENFDKIIDKMDFPIADSLIFPIDKLCEVASKEHKVVLTGEGADEMFGGYFYLNTIKNLKSLDKLPYISNFITKILKFIPENFLNLFFNYDEKLGQLGKERTIDLITNINDSKLTYLNATSLLNNDELIKYTNMNDNFTDPVNSLDFKYLQKKMIETWLPNQICTKSDQLSMAHGLETRVPFLDKRILNLILNIPETLLSNQNNSKIVYRNVLKNSGFKNFDRPKKAFYVSLSDQYKNKLKMLSNEFLNDKYIRKYDIFKKSFFDHCKYHMNKGEFVAAKRIVMISIIHRWLDIHFKG